MVALTAGRASPRIADIGTGTGCIAIALAAEMPGARVAASDVSAAALTLARENVALHGLEKRVELLEGDLAAPYLARGLGGAFDVVVSNPPYVADHEMATLSREVREHDPWRALRGGEDGLCVVRRLVAEARALAAPGGFLVVEMGEGQSHAVGEAAGRNGWHDVRTIVDGAGIERVAVFQRESDG